MTYFWREHVRSGKRRGQALVWFWVLTGIWDLGGMRVLAQASARFPVNSEQVLAAMQTHAWEVEGVQVTIAAPITAAVANPGLEIQTVTMVAAHEARLRIMCRARAACLPFFATAVWPPSAGPMSLPSELAGRGVGSREASGIDSRRPVLAGTLERPPQPTLRVGTPATLVIDGERIHIRLQVVCLEGGATGDKVRVTTRDHKQAYVAEIVTPTMLKGSL